MQKSSSLDMPVTSENMLCNFSVASLLFLFFLLLLLLGLTTNRERHLFRLFLYNIYFLSLYFFLIVSSFRICYIFSLTLQYSKTGRQFFFVRHSFVWFPGYCFTRAYTLVSMSTCLFFFFFLLCTLVAGLCSKYAPSPCASKCFNPTILFVELKKSSLMKVHNRWN